MAILCFVHVSGPREGETDRLGRLPAVIGSAPEADVKIPGLSARHAVVSSRNTDVVLQDSGSGAGTFLAGQPVQETLLHDGDVVELGREGPKLRVQRKEPRRLRFFRALATGDGPSRSATASGIRAAVREARAGTSRAFRLSLLLTLALAVWFWSWNREESRRLQEEFGRLQQAMRSAQEERRAFEDRIAAERRRNVAASDALEVRIEEFRAREEALRGELAEATGSEVLALRAELSGSQERLARLESERAAGEKIIRDFGAGVCLVQGSYAFYDEEARPLRYRLDSEGRRFRDAGGGPSLAIGGSGPIHTVDYFGTAFLARSSGLLLTNRHVAEPWWNDPRAKALARLGIRPRFVLFRAFFPQIAEPFELDVERLSDSVDLAVLKIDPRRRKIPVLPLDRGGRGAVAGQPVVVLGYPTGLEAILAKADGRVVREILTNHGRSAERVTDALSQKGLIRPSATQGHIGDITETDIVFDALTTQGGSGGPVFNRSGRVVAVEYAVLQQFGGNSFGVPIRYALQLLRPPRNKGG